MYKKSIFTWALIALLFISSALSGCIHESLDIKLEQVPDEEVEGGDDGDSDGPRMLAASYGGLRIVADYTHFTNAPSNIKNYVKNQLLPAAINYFRATLQVKQLSKLKIPGSSACGLSVPSKYRSGIKADLVLFITGESSSQSFLAWAKPCAQLSSDKRPFVGQVNFNFRGLIPESDYQFQADLPTTMHEITHVLGFSQSLYDHWPKGSTIRTKNVAGKTVKYLDANPLTKTVREHFGCSSAPGAYLEDAGGSGSAGAHFERRIFMNEYMTASEIRDARITKFTLSLLDSTGWYKVNYKMQEPIYWGKGKGCSFLDSRCSSQKFSEFCGTMGAGGCTFHGKNGGYCGNSGGGSVLDRFADNCPYVAAYSNMDCEDPGDERGAYLAAEGYGEGSKCFMGTLYPGSALSKARAYCFKYECSKQSDGDYTLKVHVGGKTVSCTNKGNEKVSGFGGNLHCPDPNKYCSTIGKKYCKRGCMGKGTCTSSGKCQCRSGWGLSDCSKKTGGDFIEEDPADDVEIDNTPQADDFLN